MAYPRLSQICRKLLNEGKFEENINLLSSIKSTEELKRALQAYPNAISYINQNALIKDFDRWNNDGRPTDDLPEYFRLLRYDSISRPLEYVLKTYLDPEDGVMGLAQRTSDVMYSVPKQFRRTFRKMISNWADKNPSSSVIYDIISDNYTYHSEEGNEASDQKTKYLARDIANELHRDAKVDKIVDIIKDIKEKELDRYIMLMTTENTALPAFHKGEFEDVEQMIKWIRKYSWLGDEMHYLKDFRKLQDAIVNSALGPSYENLIGALKQALLAKDNAADLIREQYNDMQRRVKDLEMMDDPDFKNLIEKMKELEQYVRSVSEEDLRAALKPLNYSGIDDYDDIYVSSYITSAFKEGVDEWMKSKWNSSSLYRNFKKLPEDNQKNLGSKLEASIEEIVEKQKERDEELRKSVPPEAPEDAPFNQYAFADQRKKDVPSERNTPDEEKLFRQLRAHFNQNIPITVEEAEQIKQILSKDQYRAVFHEPKVATVWRGMKVPREWLVKALGLGGAKMEAKIAAMASNVLLEDNLDEAEGEDEDEYTKSVTDDEYAKSVADKKAALKAANDINVNDIDLPDTGSKTARFVYTPRKGGSSSWAVEMKAALQFASGLLDDEYSVLLGANVKANPNSFIDGPTGLYKVPGLDKYVDEKEAVGLGRIKVSKIYWNGERGLSVDDIKASKKSSKVPEKKGKDTYSGSVTPEKKSPAKKKPIPKKKYPK